MKKLLLLFLAIMLVVCCSACSTSSSNNVNTESKEQAPKIEYYSNTNVPTLDSVTGENLIEPRGGYYLYGPYDTEGEGKAVMDIYVSALVTAHGFERKDTSVGYELTKGADTVKIFGGNMDDKLAICVMID